MKLIFSLLAISGAIASPLYRSSFMLEPVQTGSSHKASAYCLQTPDNSGENFIPYHTMALSKKQIVNSLMGPEGTRGRNYVIGGSLAGLLGLTLVAGNVNLGLGGIGFILALGLIGAELVVVGGSVWTVSFIAADHKFESKVKNGSEDKRFYSNPLEVEQISYTLKALNPDTSISCVK